MIVKRYFELGSDENAEGGWHLNGLYDSGGLHLDSRAFTYGKNIKFNSTIILPLWSDGIEVEARLPFRMSRRREGKPLDFTFADHMMPVATRVVANLLATIASADIQRFPIEIDRSHEEYDIINVLPLVDCIDVARSEIEWWGEGNDVRPELAGTPEMIYKLAIDPLRTNDHHMFRPIGWDMTIIISDEIKKVLEHERISGVTYSEV